jgi:YesN/AraC family two-component response regulator
MAKISLLVADDERNIRIGLRALLQATDDLMLVGEAASGPEAVRLTAELQPDIVPMDVIDS